MAALLRKVKDTGHDEELPPLLRPLARDVFVIRRELAEAESKYLGPWSTAIDQWGADFEARELATPAYRLARTEHSRAHGPEAVLTVAEFRKTTGHAEPWANDAERQFAQDKIDETKDQRREIEDERIAPLRQRLSAAEDRLLTLEGEIKTADVTRLQRECGRAMRSYVDARAVLASRGIELVSPAFSEPFVTLAPILQGGWIWATGRAKDHVEHSLTRLKELGVQLD